MERLLREVSFHETFKFVRDVFGLRPLDVSVGRHLGEGRMEIWGRSQVRRGRSRVCSGPHPCGFGVLRSRVTR